MLPSYWEDANMSPLYRHSLPHKTNLIQQKVDQHHSFEDAGKWTVKF